MEALEVFSAVVDRRLLMFLLLFALQLIFIPMLRMLGRDVRSGLILGASFLSGVFLGYLAAPILLGR